MSSRHVLLVAVCLTLVPVAADLAAGGRAVPIRYFAADAFYYHTVARHIAEGGALSFDGIHPTNGFHPLWQAALAALYFASMRLPWGELGYLVSVLVVSAVLVAASVWLIGAGLIRKDRPLPASFVLVPVGIYPLLLLPYWFTAVDFFGLVRWSQGTPPLPGTLWSYMNGMESGAALLAFAGLGYVFVKGDRTSPQTAGLVGLLAAGLTLARLDHVFVAAAFPLFYGARALALRDRRAWTAFGWCGVLAAVPVVAYLVANVLYAGTPLPVSGAAKTTFPVPTIENIGNIASVLRAPFDSVSSVSRAYRSAQLVLPGLVAVWVLAGAVRHRRASPAPGNGRGPDGYTLFLRLAAAGVLSLTAYDFLFVRTFAMGHWYTPVAALFASLAVFVPPARTPERPKPLIIAAMAALVLVVFTTAHRRADYHWLYNDFYFVESAGVREFYGADVPLVVEYDDGIIAFATRFPTLAGLGLMLDVEAARALEAGTLPKLALDRGFDRAASLAYAVPSHAEQRPGGPLGPDMGPERVELMRRRAPEADYEAEYISPSGNVVFVRARRPAPAPR